MKAATLYIMDYQIIRDILLTKFATAPRFPISPKEALKADAVWVSDNVMTKKKFRTALRYKTTNLSVSENLILFFKRIFITFEKI